MVVIGGILNGIIITREADWLGYPENHVWSYHVSPTLWSRVKYIHLRDVQIMQGSNSVDFHQGNGLYSMSCVHFRYMTSKSAIVKEWLMLLLYSSFISRKRWVTVSMAARMMIWNQPQSSLESFYSASAHVSTWWFARLVCPRIPVFDGKLLYSRTITGKESTETGKASGMSSGHPWKEAPHQLIVGIQI